MNSPGSEKVGQILQDPECLFSVATGIGVGVPGFPADSDGDPTLVDQRRMMMRPSICDLF
jgi:hypothetical protein